MWIKKTVLERDEEGRKRAAGTLIRVKTFMEMTWEETTSQKVTERWKGALKT